jgi:predicted PurR-regulated permease PerM
MKNPLLISITPISVVMSILVLLGFWLLFYLRDLVLIVLTAIILASSLEPVTLRMAKWGIPRILSVILIYIFGIGMIVSLFYFFVPQLVSETTNFIREIPVYLATFDIDPTELGFTQESTTLTEKLGSVQTFLRESSSGIFSALSTLFGGVITFALILVLSFYFAVQERGLDDFLKLITPKEKQKYILGLWKRAQYKMGRWLQGQILLSFLVGFFVYIGLLFLGVPYALLLGIIAALLELIPIFGSILAAIPAIAVAFVTGGVSLALFVILLYVVVNQVQGNIIYPLVVQKVLGIAPLVVILAIIVGSQLGGFLGVLIAVPIAAALQEYVNDIQKEKEKEDGKEVKVSV